MQGWQIVVWIVILQSVTEMYVTHNYTITVSFITPTALLMVQTVEASPPSGRCCSPAPRRPSSARSRRSPSSRSATCTST
ncbi:FUSC family protein [Corynebacterium macclintockiae]|uniref:FUSC family protein n=1 Tax=Corynebacterium macclintockiae TaxID=2913501 RepID=UPI003EC039F5